MGKDEEKTTGRIHLESVTSDREYKKERARRGIVVGVKEEIRKGKKKEGVRWIGEGMVEIRMGIEGEEWKVAGVYAWRNLETQLKKLEE